jgi:hypothetical protein
MRKIPPLTQSVIASCLGVGREEVNRKWRALAESHQLVKDKGGWMLSAQTSGAAGVAQVRAD